MSDLTIEGSHVIITGYETVRLDDFNRFFESIKLSDDDSSFIQFFNANMIAGWEHVYFAALNALKAFKNNSNISKNISMEVLLFASGQHQIRKALENLGVHKDITDIAVLIVTDTKREGEEILHRISEMLNRKPSKKILNITDTKIRNARKLFGISSKEIKAASRGEEKVQKIIIKLLAEHMAILSVDRKL